jgi:hypothetical protein
MEVGGSDIVTQLLTGIAAVLLLYISMALLEYLYKSFVHMWKDRVVLFPDTYVSSGKVFTAVQDPKNPESKPILLSDNQRSGVEFSYAMFINLNNQTFSDTSEKLKHIFHKGYEMMFPLMGPGIFASSNKNSIRVFMNSYSNWNNSVAIDNIPVDKWFHLVILCKKNTVYIYINGNLKSKLKLGDSPPYQNYGNAYLFSQRSKSLTIDQGGHVFDKSASGMVSSVYYYSYALTYSEIQSLMNMGPSTKINGTNPNVMSPYLSDTWWTTTY